MTRAAGLAAGWHYQAFRFELDPNDVQRGALASHAGAARFAYNTMLAYVRHGLDARGFERRVFGEATTEVPWNAYGLRKVWNTEVKVWAAPWWAENSKEAYASGLVALGAALGNFSASRRGRRRGLNPPGIVGGSVAWKRGWSHGDPEVIESSVDAALQPGGEGTGGAAGAPAAGRVGH